VHQGQKLDLFRPRLSFLVEAQPRQKALFGREFFKRPHELQSKRFRWKITNLFCISTFFKQIHLLIPSVDNQKCFIVYQTFALSQIVRLTIVTLTSLSCDIKIMSNWSSFNVFLLPTCFDHQKTDCVNN
jgi:hypothetical protein